MAATLDLTRKVGVERLVAAVRDLASARVIEDVVEVVRHAAREMVAADGATFVLRDEDKCHYVDEDAIEPLWRGMKFPLTACISGWAMLNAKAAVIPDIYVDERIPHEAYRPTFVKSLCMTPVRSAAPIAAIGTYWADNHQTTPDEIELLQALADSTAVAIENVRLLAELEERVEKRTAELQEANNDLRAFAHVTAHDLRNPLMSVRGYADLAIRIDKDNLSDEGLECLETSISQMDRMNTLIGGILEYSTAATEELATETVDFNKLAENVLGDLNQLIVNRGAKVDVRDLPTGIASPPMMERVLANLITNGINYGEVETPVVIVDGHTEDDGSLVITVTDNGNGVSESDVENIFTMFKRGDSRKKAEGSGIGLAFVARVMARHGGTISVTNAPLAGGACFTITLPG